MVADCGVEAGGVREDILTGQVRQRLGSCFARSENESITTTLADIDQDDRPIVGYFLQLLASGREQEVLETRLAADLRDQLVPFVPQPQARVVRARACAYRAAVRLK